jgi:hypothetical protein
VSVDGGAPGHGAQRDTDVGPCALLPSIHRCLGVCICDDICVDERDCIAVFAHAPVSREAHDAYQRVLCELSASVLDVAKVAYQSGALPCTEASEDVLTALRDVVGACEEAKTALSGSSVPSELVDRLLSQLRIE